MSDARQRNIDEINSSGSGYDVVIVCTGTQRQADFWQARLESGKGVLLPATSSVVAVHEDWPGGAGNGLGTFYAYLKACAAAKERFDMDLPALLAAGTHSIGLFHTAGKGTRLAPLPAAENNNKPGVKLPVSTKMSDGSATPLSILESVIKQTGAYASSRKGRLSVFWGDQVFIPSVEVAYVPSCHVDILCTLGPMADEASWAEKGLQNYGLIAVGSSGSAAQVDKVTFAQATKMLSGLGDIESVGVSLGSFSLSNTILEAFMTEFKSELEAKVGKLDTDPHLWMPLTLRCEDYCELMSSKGVPAETSEAHHARMAAFMERFAPAGALPDGKGLFGAVNIGTDAFWWDYGQLRWYLKNNLMLAGDSEDGDGMRRFFQVGRGAGEETAVGVAAVDPLSCVSASQIGAGTITKSVVCHTISDLVECEGSIVVGVTAQTIKLGKGCIVYNVADESEGGIVLGDEEVLVGVAQEDGTQMLIRSRLSIDGGKAWKTVVEGNPHSFEALHGINADADILKIDEVRGTLHRTASGSVKAAAAAKQ